MDNDLNDRTRDFAVRIKEETKALTAIFVSLINEWRKK
jgi:hypothetical protein